MKKIALIVVAFILLVNGVGAMNTSSIENQIIMAQQKLEKIENELLAKDTELFLTYKYDECSDLFGRAGTKLREKYSKEYWEYIETKAQLDDLRYMQFLMLVNGMSSKK